MTHDFTRKAGDTYELEVTLATANPSVAGATIVCVVARVGTDRVVREYVAGDGITVTDIAAGEFTISFMAADTNVWRGLYRYECRVTGADGSTVTPVEGVITVNPKLEN